MSEIEELTTAIREFARARDWERFHTPKNLAMALSVEVAELVELFQWLTPEESATLVDTPDGRAAIEDEIADIAIYLLRIADLLSVDVERVVRAKLKRNQQRFPAADGG
jgi:NTP pyrophosphatase (non-canonical NTP hydrolase)